MRELVKARGIDPDDPAGFQFRGAHQRDPGRIDVRNHHAMDEAPFDHPLLNEEAAWMPVVRRVLGDDAQLIFKGLVVTEPGTDEQAWHPDGPEVSRAVWEQHAGPDAPELAAAAGGTLPAHCLCVFIPMVDLSSENGPTAFLPGTHHSQTVAHLKADAADASGSGSSAAMGLPASVDVNAGDAIIFDVRCMHAGSSNTSATRRPLLYQVYGRSWYDEALQNRLNEDLGLARRGVRAEKLFPQRGEEPPFASLEDVLK